MSSALHVGAVVLFVLVGFGVEVGAFTPLDLLAFGLAAFALAHVVP